LTAAPQETVENGDHMTFDDVKAFSDRVGAGYGSEDLALLLYALVKMQKPRTVVELGTGDGASTVWIARALQENSDGGHIMTADNGSQYEIGPHLAEDERKATYAEYLDHIFKKFGVADTITRVDMDMPPFPLPEGEIDLLFADFAHGVASVAEIICTYMPKLADVASIFIDSAPTFLPSKLLIDRLVDDFNRGVMPASLLARLSPDDQTVVTEKLRRCRFQVVHLTTAGRETQNSTAWIKIQPDDILPWPQAPFRLS